MKSVSLRKVVENYSRYGRTYSLRGKDGVLRKALEIKGSYQGKVGVFQYYKDYNGVIKHRLFVPKG